MDIRESESLGSYHWDAVFLVSLLLVFFSRYLKALSEDG